MPSPRRLRARANPWLVLRRSGIHGRGVYARVDIPAETRLIEYVGERIGHAEADRRDAIERARRHHTFLFIVNQRTVIDARYGGNASKYINHSCDPNCDAVIDDARIFIETVRDISPGEELAYDYQYTLEERHTPARKRQYPCHCGAAKCRGTILAKKR